MKVVPKALPVLCCLNMLMVHYQKFYCFPSQVWILKYLKSKLGFILSRRQLNRILRDIESSGLIKRTRRHRRDGVRGMLFKSTLYEISIRGYKLLYRVGMISKARFLLALDRVRSFLQAKKRPEKVLRTSSGLESLHSIIKPLWRAPG